MCCLKVMVCRAGNLGLTSQCTHTLLAKFVAKPAVSRAVLFGAFGIYAKTGLVEAVHTEKSVCKSGPFHL